MGGFLLARREHNVDFEETERQIKDGIDVFRKKGLLLNKKIITHDLVIYVFNKYKLSVDNVVLFDNDQFIISTGTLIYKGKVGVLALKELFSDFSGNSDFLSNVLGQYALIISKNNSIFLLNDQMGVYHVFNNKSKTVISSSFLAVLKTLKKKTLATQELYEYLTHEAFYGDKTIIEEIELIDFRKIWQLFPTMSNISKNMNIHELIDNRSFDESIKVVSNSLIENFKLLKSAFGNNVCSALSGGFDSRLMLALMRKTGIKPYLYVYGNEKSLDVKIAKSISTGEGLNIDNEQKESISNYDEEKFIQFLEKQYYWMDGLGETGIFDNGFDMFTRLKRAGKAKLQLHGAGGEIFRNRLMLPDRIYNLKEVIFSQFDNVNPSMFTSQMNKAKYLANIIDKSKIVFSGHTEQINRNKVEMIHPLFSLNYWLGCNAKINNQLIYTFYPFIDSTIAFQSSEIPFRFKKYGIFEAALVKYVDPALAGYSSQYGFSFSEYNNIPLLFKTKYFIKLYAPISTKAFMRRHFWKRDKVGRDKFPYYFSTTYLSDIFPGKLNISEYVNIDKIIDPDMFSRALSVELLIRDKY